MLNGEKQVAAHL